MTGLGSKSRRGRVKLSRSSYRHLMGRELGGELTVMRYEVHADDAGGLCFGGAAGLEPLGIVRLVAYGARGWVWLGVQGCGGGEPAAPPACWRVPSQPLPPP